MCIANGWLPFSTIIVERLRRSSWSLLSLCIQFTVYAPVHVVINKVAHIRHVQSIKLAELT